MPKHGVVDLIALGIVTAVDSPMEMGYDARES
jgi:hypothetical protein